jgi:hypothetical protein
MTDSEQVPRGKGEKHPGEGSEIEPETVSLQAVEGLMAGLCAGESRMRAAMPDGVPFGE